MMKDNIISIGLSPNMQSDDIALVRDVIHEPVGWFNQDTVGVLRTELQHYLGSAESEVHLLMSGRTALEITLEALGLKDNDEVIVQAFTCVAVTNAIKWAKGTVVFADIDKNTLNPSLQQITSKVTNHTRAIVIQNTFGLPFQDFSDLQKFARERGIVIINDCAHALGARLNEQRIEQYGDATVLSFGRDKVISSVFGGALIVHPSLDQKATETIRQHVAQLELPPKKWVLKQLLHPLVTDFILKTYDRMYVGQMSNAILQRLGLLSKATTASEKQCQNSPEWLYAEYPGGLARLAQHQLHKVDTFNKHRQAIADYYQAQGIETMQNSHVAMSDRIWLRYTVYDENPRRMHGFFRKHRIILGDWYDQVVGPKEVDLTCTNYEPGTAPNAEDVSRHCVNLPTHPRMTLEDAHKVVDVYNRYKQTYGR